MVAGDCSAILKPLIYKHANGTYTFVLQITPTGKEEELSQEVSQLMHLKAMVESSLEIIYGDRKWKGGGSGLPLMALRVLYIVPDLTVGIRAADVNLLKTLAFYDQSLAVDLVRDDEGVPLTLDGEYFETLDFDPDSKRFKYTGPEVSVRVISVATVTEVVNAYTMMLIEQMHGKGRSLEIFSQAHSVLITNASKKVLDAFFCGAEVSDAEWTDEDRIVRKRFSGTNVALDDITLAQGVGAECYSELPVLARMAYGFNKWYHEVFPNHV